MAEQKFTKINIKNLIKNQDNPKINLTQRQKDSLKLSLEKFGFRGVLIVYPTEDGKYMVLDGNNRYDQMLAIGEKEIDCVVLDDMSEEDARKFVLSYDQVKGDYDKDVLLEKAKELVKEGSSIEEISKLTFLDEKELNIFKITKEELKKMEKDEPVKEKKTSNKVPVVLSFTEEQKQQFDFVMNKANNKVRKVLEMANTFVDDITSDFLINIVTKYYFDKNVEFTNKDK
jgi:hypothetical protein